MHNKQLRGGLYTDRESLGQVYDKVKGIVSVADAEEDPLFKGSTTP